MMRTGSGSVSRDGTETSTNQLLNLNEADLERREDMELIPETFVTDAVTFRTPG